MKCTNTRCYCYNTKHSDNCMTVLETSECPDFWPEEKLPCGNKDCGSYDKKHPDHCKHGFSDFSKFTCKNYIEDNTEKMIAIQDCR